MKRDGLIFALISTSIGALILVSTFLELPSLIIQSGSASSNIVILKETTRKLQLHDAVDNHLPVTAFRKHAFPCYQDHVGFIFIKVKKCASSTTQDIVKRIAYRQYPANKKGSKIPKDHLLKCKSHSDHSPASIIYYVRNRNPLKSYLFSFVREPTSRSISHFFFEDVSQRNVKPTLENFKIAATRPPNDHPHPGYENVFPLMGGYQFNYLTTHQRDTYPDVPLGTFWDPDNPSVVNNPELILSRVSDILKEYDFIGTVERFDESLVALSFLLELSVGDIMYAVSEKHSGSYELKNGKCFLIKPKVITHDMERFFQSKEWHAQIAGDEVLYESVNESLDKTIDEVIGKKAFKKRLQEFERLQQFASARGCSDPKYHPCSDKGKRQPVPCKRGTHSECFYDCIDKAYEAFKRHNAGVTQK